MDDKVLEQISNVASLPGHRRRRLRHAGRALGLRLPDRRRRRVRSRAGRRRLGRRRRLRHLLRRAHPADRPDARRYRAAARTSLADSLFRQIPAGVGSTGARSRSTDARWTRCCDGGARWAVAHGYGSAEDLERIEEGGAMAGALARCRLRAARKTAPARGDGHARLRQPLSRGAGGRRRSSTTRPPRPSACARARSSSASIAARAASAIRSAPTSCARWRSPRRRTASRCPISNSPARRSARSWASAISARCAPAINCALANRQIITHLTRRVFGHFFPRGDARPAVRRLAQHLQGGGARSRRQAARACSSIARARRAPSAPGHPELPAAFAAIGQPVFIGGSMGTRSAIMVGPATAAGARLRLRLPRRRAAAEPAPGAEAAGTAGRSWTSCAGRGIIINSPSMRGVAEEAPGAYKDIGAVVEAAHRGRARAQGGHARSRSSASRADRRRPMIHSGEPDPNFWQIALPDLEKQLAAGRNGLSSAEAAARRLRYGPNTLEARRRLSLPLKFLSRFRNPLVIILLVAAAISARNRRSRQLHHHLDDRADQRGARHRAGIPRRSRPPNISRFRWRSRSRSCATGRRLPCWGRTLSPAMSCCSPPGIWFRRMDASSRPGIFSSTRPC